MGDYTSEWRAESPVFGDAEAMVYDSNDHAIAAVYHEPHARLTSAAPTMLKALKAAEVELRHVVDAGEGGDSTPDTLNRIIAARNEATVKGRAFEYEDGETP